MKMVPNEPPRPPTGKGANFQTPPHTHPILKALDQNTQTKF